MGAGCEQKLKQSTIMAPWPATVVGALYQTCLCGLQGSIGILVLQAVYVGRPCRTNSSPCKVETISATSLGQVRPAGVP